ncbi:MAG TPA: hypothetical protein VEQ59_13375 [Polyangiaceae bacterium]|nr:hypothetical protein [Polyangiaceae bacterium]
MMGASRGPGAQAVEPPCAAAAIPPWPPPALVLPALVLPALAPPALALPALALPAFALAPPRAIDSTESELRAPHPFTLAHRLANASTVVGLQIAIRASHRGV